MPSSRSKFRSRNLLYGLGVTIVTAKSPLSADANVKIKRSPPPGINGNGVKIATDFSTDLAEAIFAATGLCWARLETTLRAASADLVARYSPQRTSNLLRLMSLKTFRCSAAKGASDVDSCSAAITTASGQNNIFLPIACRLKHRPTSS